MRNPFPSFPTAGAALLAVVVVACFALASATADEPTPAADWPTAVERWLPTTDSASSNPLSLYLGGLRLVDVAFYEKSRGPLSDLLERRWDRNEILYKQAVMRYAAPIFKILDGNKLPRLEYPAWTEIAPNPYDLPEIDRDRVFVLADMMILTGHGWVESMNIGKSALFYDGVLEFARNLTGANTGLHQRLIALEIRARAFRQHLWCMRTISLPGAAEYEEYLRVLPRHVELDYPLRESLLETIERDVRWPLTHAADLVEMGDNAPEGSPAPEALTTVKDRVPELLMELRGFQEAMEAALGGAYADWRAFDQDDRLDRLDPFLRDRMPDLREARVREAWSEALARLAVVSTAVQRYRRAEGDWPAGLRVLGLDPSLLTDPFSGEELVYRERDSGALVYSVGPDGRDDGGSESWTPERGFAPAKALGDVFVQLQ